MARTTCLGPIKFSHLCGAVFLWLLLAWVGPIAFAQRDTTGPPEGMKTSRDEMFQRPSRHGNARRLSRYTSYANTETPAVTSDSVATSGLLRAKAQLLTALTKNIDTTTSPEILPLSQSNIGDSGTPGVHIVTNNPVQVSNPIKVSGGNFGDGSDPYSRLLG